MSNASYKGRPWSWGIIAVIALFMIGTLAFVRFALTQRVDLVATDYYERSVAYDDVMENRARGEQLQPVSVLVSPDSVLLLMPAYNKLENIRVSLYRASDSSLDTYFDVFPDSTGRWRMPLDNLASGFWRILVTGTFDGKTFEQQYQWMKP
jgi:hypothetical protein